MDENFSFILIVLASIASSIEVACFLHLDFPKQYLPPTLIKIIGVLILLTHEFIVVILYLGRGTANPERNLGWRKKAAFDFLMMLIGVGFHFLLDNKVRSLVLVASMSFDFMVVSLLLYPFMDVNLLDVAIGLLLEVAMNINKISGSYVLPSALLLGATLILWRAYANSRA